MDQVKAIAYTVFNKHLFWTLSVILILVGFVGWWLSSGKLKQEFDSNYGTVTSTKSTIDTILQKPENQIFNTASHEGMKEMNAQRRLEVLRAWQQKYDKQRTEVLVWPEGLSSKFTTAIDDLLQGKPIEEVKPKADGTEHLVFPLREEYRNEIKGLLPKLAEMINAQWSPQGSAVGGRGGESGSPFGSRPTASKGSAAVAGTKPEKEYAIWWDPTDQGQIETTHFDWSNSDELPTTMEILYSMEDYWVLKALMQIVQRTNKDEETGQTADQPHRAVIREIHSIKIGSATENNAGQIYAVASPVGEGEAPVETAAVTPPPATGGEGVVEGAAGTAPTGPDPADGRYVDKAYVPLSADKLKSATESGDPLEAYLAVAKRMPVRMKVKMDQRKLNKFLVECGNADLMLEVKQVRINPDAPDILSLSGSNKSGGARGSFGGGPFSGGRGSENSSGPGTDAKYPWDVVVEVYGIIYIFNPPSEKRLTDKLEADEIEQFKAAMKTATPSNHPGNPANPAQPDTASDAPAASPAADEAAKTGEAAAAPG